MTLYKIDHFEMGRKTIYVISKNLETLIYYLNNDTSIKAEDIISIENISNSVYMDRINA